MRSSRNPLLSLPTEIIQRIAYLLPNDSDIAHFSSCCKSLAEKTTPAESSIWRQRFSDIYDTPPDRSSYELKVEYQIRAIVLAQIISFKQGEKESQTLWLTVLHDMILESFHLAGQEKDGGSKTFRRIREALKDSEFLNRPVSGHGFKEPDRPSELFCAVQLSLTGLALDPDMSVQCLRTDYDIGSVYFYRLMVDEVIDPLPFVIQPLDLQRIMHIRNFWLRHLLNLVEATFYTSYAKLAPEHRPAALTNVHPSVPGIAECPQQASVVCRFRQPPDTSGSHGMYNPFYNCSVLTDIRILTLKPDNDPLNWPPVFQDLIPLGDGADRLYFRGIQRYHDSDDQEINFVRGFVEPSQTAKGGFTAWQRVCFAIYEADRETLPLLEEDGTPSDGDIDWLPNETWPPADLGLDFACVHGYEGRLLPGGRIMMGQWVDMLDTTGRGPFIFWDI